ncbi:large ribosomal subunit protein uL10m-like [Crassostrea virginica]
MAALVKKLSPGWHLCNNWFLITTRNLQKGNFRVRKSKLTSKRMFELVTEEFVKVPPKPPRDISCTRYKKAHNEYSEEEENPYYEFRNRMCQEFLKKDENFCICHRNPISAKTVYDYKIKLKEKGFRPLFGMTNTLLRKNIPDTKFEVLAPYLVSHNVLITNAEGGDFRSLPKLLKKMPEFILLGGYIDGKLLSKEDITNFSKLPDLEICQSETAGILSLISGGKTSSLFHSHIQTLGANMKQYEKQMKKKND